ncbi:MAG: hypothetical protein M3063_15460 [Actinomycetota bacterium]|nr:hypothetical protein [Actinomycetota bacterium]
MTSIPWAAAQPAVSRSGRARSANVQLPLPDAWSALVPLLAGALVASGILIGWRGSDLPAQIYRVEAIRQHGLALWDSQWFAGHWMLGYSVLYPALTAVTGLAVMSVLSAMAAAVAFDRLFLGHFGRAAARPASIAFAVSLTVETAIGQLPFLAGEAAGLWCCLALARHRPWLAALGALFAGLLSPLAGAFVALAVLAWLLATWWPQASARSSRDRMADGLHRPGVGGALGVVAAIGALLGLVGLLFPGQGPMPYPLPDCAWELSIAAALWLITPVTERALRFGLVLFGLAAVASVSVPSALGGNIGRMEDCLALPLAVVLLWPRRRLLLALLAVPLVLSQWGPAWGAMTSARGHPWMIQSYYQPLIRWLHHAGGPTGRVEVVPTADHWESAYVAPSVALARGWERQLDVADNPLFYDRDELNNGSYLAWLLDNGVRYVALPSAPLDYAGVAEGQLVAAGVPGLHQVRRTPHWTVYQVDGATGIVSGPGNLSKIDGSHLSVNVSSPGTVEVRVHDNPGWKVASGAATLDASPDGWILVHAFLPGPVHLALGLPVP